MSQPDTTLDLDIIEERRAVERAATVTASAPFTVVRPKRYRITFFGMAYVESFTQPQIRPLARWILSKLGIVISIEG